MSNEKNNSKTKYCLSILRYTLVTQNEIHKNPLILFYLARNVERV